jgi:hypothetical protein
MFDFGISNRNGVEYFNHCRAVIRWRNGGLYFIIRDSLTAKWRARY